MGYREDGNFNINWEYDGLTDPGKYAKENAKFIYPDAGIRFLQGQAALDAAMGRVTTLTKGDYKLHRGYIRNLEQPQFGPVPITRCNFQFNPQQIQQNVSMRDDVYLPMLQPPEQLAQPLGANVNFSFDLLFDRSHELAKGSGTFQGTADSAERGSPGATADTNNIGENDAYDIGVLADLRVLYSVIGQGFSKEMIDFQAKMFEYNANNQFDRENPSDTTTTESTTDETTADTETPPSSQQSPKLTDIENLINSNVGNFALLMPMPVRVMFSSLFMVDGFITSTSVDFLKFNTKMVPVQCRVGLSMNALYIGFARQTTYLTDTFRRAADAIAARNSQLEAAREELLAALIISCKTFLIGASYENLRSNVIDWDKAKTLRHAYELPVYALALGDERLAYNRNLFLGFPDIEPIKGGDITIIVGGEEVLIKEGQDRDAVLALYQNGVPVQFTYNWSITVWGRVPGQQSQPPLPEDIAKKFKDGTLPPEQAAVANIKVLGSYSGTESSSNENDWGKGESGDGVDAKRVRRRSIRSIKNTASDAYKIGAIEGLDTTWANNSYFIIEIAVDFSVSSGESQPITYSYKSKEVKKGDQDFDRRIFISWTGAGAGNGGTETPTMPIGRLGEVEIR